MPRVETRLTVPPQKVSGLLGARFVPEREIPNVMSPAQAARVLEALAGRTLPILLYGRRPD